MKFNLLPHTDEQFHYAVEHEGWKPRAAPAVHRLSRRRRGKVSKNARRAQAATRREYERQRQQFFCLVAMTRNARDFIGEMLRQPSFTEQIFSVLRITEVA